MPYITPKKRDEFDVAGLAAVAATIETMGDFNYVISYLANYIVNLCPDKSYGYMSAIRGAISDASEEFYRKVMAPYEDVKCQENGDVYD